MGSNSWPQYNLAPLIAHSVHIGKPVIGVAVNYRLGPLGFLASGKRNVAGNFGFKDQANAFRWIRRHIEGFGGDAGNVTAVGESAGAISLSTLLCAEGEKEGRLFDRVVLMSGEVTLRGPRGWGWHERMFEEQERVLGLKGRELWEMDAVEMCKKLPLAQHFCPLVDGESGWFGGRRVDFGVLIDGRDERGKREWCREFVVGDMADDVCDILLFHYCLMTGYRYANNQTGHSSQAANHRLP